MVYIELAILAIVFYVFRKNQKFNGWAAIVCFVIPRLLEGFGLGTDDAMFVFIPIFFLNYIGLYMKNKKLRTQNEKKTKTPS